MPGRLLRGGRQRANGRRRFASGDDGQGHRVGRAATGSGDYSAAYFVHGLGVRRPKGWPSTPTASAQPWPGRDPKRGKRYSWGYPACPDLDQHAIVWQCCRPSEIGAALTELPARARAKHGGDRGAPPPGDVLLDRRRHARARGGGCGRGDVTTWVYIVGTRQRLCRRHVLFSFAATRQRLCRRHVLFSLR